MMPDSLKHSIDLVKEQQKRDSMRIQDSFETNQMQPRLDLEDK